MRVVNASPLIVLSKLGRLDLLLEPRPDIEVVVPQAVLDKVMRGEPDDPAVSLVPKAVADWMRGNSVSVHHSCPHGNSVSRTEIRCQYRMALP